MKIERINNIKDRNKHKELFLIGDEEEEMLMKYFNQGVMFLIYDKGLKGGIIIVESGENTIEIKNISIYEEFHRKGYGKKLIEHIFSRYKKRYRRVIVGTGNSPRTIPFYKALEFKQYFVVKDFFIKNYSEKIFEDGVQLKDMIYLEKYI